MYIASQVVKCSYLEGLGRLNFLSQETPEMASSGKCLGGPTVSFNHGLQWIALDIWTDLELTDQRAKSYRCTSCSSQYLFLDTNWSSNLSNV